MSKERLISNNKVLVIGVIIALALAVELASSVRNRDVNFCRRAFYYLVKGRNSAQAMIDWDNLQATGVDVGGTYSSFSGVNEKKFYRKNFINRFAAGFLQVKGDYKSFVNWRVYEKGSDFVTVAVDYKNTGNTLLFILPRKGKKKVQIIKWKKQGDIVK